MKTWREASLFGSLIVLGCVYDIFPPGVVKSVDRNFDFAHWRMGPSQLHPTTIELGGRIIEMQTSGGIVTIVTAELPIVHHPAFGPKQGLSKGPFAITYRGNIDPPFLHRGNRLLVIGITRGSTMVPIDGIVRSLPTIEASCLHIWKTGESDIADIGSAGGGYAVLEEETFCAAIPRDSGCGAKQVPKQHDIE